MRNISLASIALVLLASSAHSGELSAVVQKASVDVYAEPRFDASKVTTLQRDAAVKVSGQQGLWYQLALPEGASGFVRINDVRMEYAGTEGGDANLRVLMEGKAGQGRVTETAGVRGIEESDLKSASLNRPQLDQMIGNRVDGPSAASYASTRGWQATQVEYASEAKPGKGSGKGTERSASSQAATTKVVTGLLGSLGVAVPLGVAVSSGVGVGVGVGRSALHSAG